MHAAHRDRELLMPAKLVESQVPDIEMPTIVPPMEARQLAVRTDLNTDIILATETLTKEFKGFRAVQNINLRVRRGQIHALIGANGAGKTTCFNLLTKYISPTSGSIYFNGHDITAARPAQIAMRGMVRSFQISSIFPQLTVLQNVRLALQRDTNLSLRFWRSVAALSALNDDAMEVLEQVDLGCLADLRAGDLPYGRKRALELATTLAKRPELMLLDEPTQGMGHEDVARVTQLIKKVAVNRTVLMVEHNMGVVSGICDRITVMQRGEILAEGTYREVASDLRVRDSYMGRTKGTNEEALHV
jgi:branched-chain amino acid transport system ATP-binding protein